MKRYWIFIALFAAGMTFAPKANANPFPGNGPEKGEFSHNGLTFDQVMICLAATSELTGMELAQLSKLFFAGDVVFKPLGNGDVEVTINAGGNTMIAVLIDSL